MTPTNFVRIAAKNAICSECGNSDFSSFSQKIPCKQKNRINNFDVQFEKRNTSNVLHRSTQQKRRILH